jgi:ABC-2 type transport system permease protein
MTATTYAPPMAGAGSPARPGLVRLTLVEMRKMVDTRAGKWLVGITGAISLAVVTIALFAGDGSDRTFRAFFEYCQYPVGLFLPVLGILLVTSEWSQRTALTTFTLTPERQRIAVAKLLAATAFGLLSLLTSFAGAALGNGLTLALDRGDGSWSLPGDLLAGAALFQVLSVVMGVAFGMLLMNPALAIVTYFVAPTVLSIVRELIPRTEKTISWIDLNAPMERLAAGTMNGDMWERLAVSGAVWVLLPLVLGMIRLQRREVS